MESETKLEAPTGPPGPGEGPGATGPLGHGDAGAIGDVGAVAGVENGHGSAEAERITALSLQLLEEKQKSLELGEQVAHLNRQLARATREREEAEAEQAAIVARTNAQLAKSSSETAALREEIEQLSAALFQEANLQVETAKKSQWDVKQLNDRLAETLETKDNTIEVLQAELAAIKRVVGELEARTEAPPATRVASESTETGSSPLGPRAPQCDFPEATLFDVPALAAYNLQPLATTTFNQLRHDSPFALAFKDSLTTNSPETWNVRATKLFELVVADVEACVRLDKAPALRYKFSKRSLVTGLLDYKARIEPLSAGTEVWKRAQVAAAAAAAAGEYDAGLAPAAPAGALGGALAGASVPLAVHSSCSLCGEKRTAINHARLYKLTIFKSPPESYSLCISCASKWRVVIPLMSVLGSLRPLRNFKPTALPSGQTVIPALVDLYEQYFKLVPYVIALAYLKMGIWEEGDVCGLVYGWRNSWLGKFVSTESTVSASKASTETTVASGEPIEDSTEEPTGDPAGEPSEVSNTVPDPTAASEPVTHAGIDLHVVSVAKRISVNLNLLAGGAEHRPKEDSPDDSDAFVDAEDATHAVGSAHGESEPSIH